MMAAVTVQRVGGAGLGAYYYAERTAAEHAAGLLPGATVEAVTLNLEGPEPQAALARFLNDQRNGTEPF